MGNSCCRDGGMLEFFVFRFLETENCRCDSLQKELESLNVNHEKDLSRVRDEYNEEINRLVENHKHEKKKEADQGMLTNHISPMRKTLEKNAKIVNLFSLFLIKL